MIERLHLKILLAQHSSWYSFLVFCSAAKKTQYTQRCNFFFLFPQVSMDFTSPPLSLQDNGFVSISSCAAWKKKSVFDNSISE